MKSRDADNEPSQKQRARQLKSMAAGLMKKAALLSDLHDVEVLLVIYNRNSAVYQDFCSCDPSLLFHHMMIAKTESVTSPSSPFQSFPRFQESEFDPNPKKARKVTPKPSVFPAIPQEIETDFERGLAKTQTSTPVSTHVPKKCASASTDMESFSTNFTLMQDDARSTCVQHESDSVEAADTSQIESDDSAQSLSDLLFQS